MKLDSNICGRELDSNICGRENTQQMLVPLGACVGGSWYGWKNWKLNQFLLVLICAAGYQALAMVILPSLASKPGRATSLLHLTVLQPHLVPFDKS